ncbi:MAG: beta-lactamase domain protein [Polaromonas sp.]|nr:beta-lactamase domain protein [Polaromonas sp.]
MTLHAPRQPALLHPEPAVQQVGEALWQVVSGVFTSNCYISGTGGATGCILIDPGLDPAGIDAQLAVLGKKPEAVLCTHGHFDHVGGAAYFQHKYGVPVYLPANDRKTMQSSNFLMMAVKIAMRIELPDATLVPPEGGTVEAGGTSYTFQPLPGHTPGSCLVRNASHVFSGDSLYARGVGLSHLPGEDRNLLRAGIRALWDTLPADVLICPGHGPAARFGDICRENAALLTFLQASD